MELEVGGLGGNFDPEEQLVLGLPKMASTKAASSSLTPAKLEMIYDCLMVQECTRFGIITDTRYGINYSSRYGSKFGAKPGIRLGSKPKGLIQGLIQGGFLQSLVHFWYKDWYKEV